MKAWDLIITSMKSKIEQLEKDAIENMDGSLYSHLRDLLGKGLFFGFSALQLVFERGR
jgi:hypothetical protein